MRMDNITPEEILNSLPSKYYIIHLKTKKIIQTNDSELKFRDTSCFSQLFEKKLPCNNSNGLCVCEQLIQLEKKPNLLLKKESV